MGQFWIPNDEKYVVQTPQWRDEIEGVDPDPLHKVLHHTIVTPEGKLTYKTGGDLTTTWITEYLIEKYMPVARLDTKKVAEAYDAVGDAGILRGFAWGDRAGCWQHACYLMDARISSSRHWTTPTGCTGSCRSFS